MILKTYPNKNLYGNYFLAMEAPDDEVVAEDRPKPRRNVKVISVKPSNRGKDFTQVGNPTITSDDDVNNDVDLDETDYTATTGEEPPVEMVAPEENPDGEPQIQEDNTDNQSEKPDDTESADNAPNTDSDDDFTETNEDTPDENPDTVETGEDAPDTNGDDDFTANTTDQNTTDDSTDSAPDANASKPTQNAPGVELDSTRKYNLYKEYMSLYNACDNYISKLENILKNDFEENQIIRISVSNLREIKDILFDYMTIRFPLNTYVQSLLFYQKMVVAIQLVFNLLKSINGKIQRTKI